MLITTRGVLLFGENTAASTTMHRQPAYKLVIAVDGTVCWRWSGPEGNIEQVGPGVLVPPEIPHAIRTSGPYRALLVEPWVDGAPSSTTPMALSPIPER